MFKKILIANRGEIACRVMSTARRMGISTVAVYSDADADALHVQIADEAVRLGPPPASESYLKIDAVIEACRQTGAEAVHPGYGFLSENAAFASALDKAGITFIGPGIRAIKAMGDKIESKKVAHEAGVSTVPGYLGEIDTAQSAAKIAEEIGYPVMIKASAGGGGKGMRIAQNEKELEEGFRLARSEAKSSFGDDRVFIERFIVDPRHIEIQVLADHHGNILYLGERECSIQRRNQKVIEEAPSPLLTPETRKAMGEQAVALARAVDYRSAGTVEFIADQKQNFFFLEMNTRLQVEHPVTEMVTGLDLVEQMIRVAAGEQLGFAQDDVKLDGWAVESRIYAEDPYRSFLPSIGRLLRFREPPLGSHDGVTVRLDTGVTEGGEISIHYDPMIAKLVVHAPDRERATAATTQALDAFHIGGIRHNIPFLSAVMEHPRWSEGRLSTAFIAEEFPDGFSGLELDEEMADMLAAVAAHIDHLNNERRQEITGRVDGGHARFSTDRVVEMSGAFVRAALESHADVLRVAVQNEDGSVRRRFEVASAWVPGQPVWSGAIDSQDVFVQVTPILNGVRLLHRGREVEARVYTRREAELARLMPVKEVPDLSRYLLCPMPGLVVSIAVAEGQKVEPGEALCVVEAMKMENVLRAERGATVSAIKVEPGDSLAVDDVIMEFE